MGLTATQLYGYDPTHVQPTATATPLHAGLPEPSIDTHGPAGKAASPAIALVGLVAIVILLSQLTFQGTVKVGS